MIKFAINKFCNKKRKNEDKNYDNDFVEYCLRDLQNLDKKITTINNRLENDHKCIEENKKEINELKRKNKMLVHTLRIFAIYFIMKN